MYYSSLRHINDSCKSLWPRAKTINSSMNKPIFPPLKESQKKQGDNPKPAGRK